LESVFSVTDLQTDVADIYDAHHLLQSFPSRNTSAFTVFLTYCGQFGRRSQSWWCSVQAWSRAQVALCARFFMAIQICLLSSTCFLGSLTVQKFVRFL